MLQAIYSFPQSDSKVDWLTDELNRRFPLVKCEWKIIKPDGVSYKYMHSDQLTMTPCDDSSKEAREQLALADAFVAGWLDGIEYHRENPED